MNRLDFEQLEADFDSTFFAKLRKWELLLAHQQNDYMRWRIRKFQEEIKILKSEEQLLLRYRQDRN